MKRSWHVWLVFAVCVLGAVGAMVWLTRQAIESDHLRQVAQADAELEQNVSLALWRMDTELAPIIAEEVVRPPAAFRPSNSGTVKPPQYVLLQFEARDQGFWWSPQIGIWRSYTPELDELSEAVDFSRLLAQLPDTPLPTAAYVQKNPFAALEQKLVQEGLNPHQFLEGNRVSLPAQEAAQQVTQQSAKPTQAAKAADFEQRNKRYQSAAQQSLSNYQQGQVEANAPPDLVPRQGKAVQEPPDEHIGVSRPVWIGDRLILARRVAVGSETRLQGCWLDWPQLKSRLLGETTGLLPHADLVPVNGDASADPSRMLAGLPVRLVVGETSVAAPVGPTLRWALWLGWGALAVATAAAAALLYGVMALSERRAAFVSSVSHELRTPLTTFRMYAEMLARGMVPDAARRQEYLETLQREAERLTLLVENVLAYARLERGRRPQADDCVTVKMLADRVGPRLAQRAAQVEMECELWLDGMNAETNLTTDLNVVEQILFNLVDNAAKYARSATNRMIEVVATREGRWVKLAVSDHGPGFASGGKGWRTRPFAKSAEESAETAPGVGLGLALCQRLAGQLGGRLEVTVTPGGGATVTLCLPVE